MPNCPACGVMVHEADRRCPRCGTSLTDVSETAALGAPVGVGTAPATLAPGDVVAGRFRIVALAGRGGMGEVYHALDLKLDQAVALKGLPAHVASDPGRLARLFNEIRVARHVSHPNVCRVYDLVEAGERSFLAMEWVDGEDLAAVLARGRLPAERAVAIARQVCAGLAAVHERGVIHRDLKPGNVLIDARGVARLADFGLAEIAPALHGASAREGTPAWMAPEQLQGREATAKSDVYALGLLLYELFAGRPAYGGAATTLDALRREREAAPAAPSSGAPEIDRRVDAAILRCLAADPARRPSSALEVAAALPGGARFDVALAAAQRRADRIAAFREELTELRRAGVLELEDGELGAVQRFHDEALQGLVRNYDVDTSERGKALSLGMRLVAMLGAVALAASVVYMFYDVWGRLGLATQVAVLTTTPLALLVATAVIVRREPAGHFATLAAMAAFGATALDVGALGAVFNMRTAPGAALVCGLFGLLLAYAFELRLPLVAGAASMAYFVAGVLAERAGCPWYAALQRPETLLLGGALCLAATRLPRRVQPPGFAALYNVLGLVLLLWPPLLLGVAGAGSVLPLPVSAIEILYEALGFAGGAAALALGVARARKELAYGGALFLLLWLVTLLVHWLWDAVPRSLFFFSLALLALGSLAVLKRLRVTLAAAREATP